MALEITSVICATIIILSAMGNMGNHKDNK